MNRQTWSMRFAACSPSAVPAQAGLSACGTHRQASLGRSAGAHRILHRILHPRVRP